MKKFLIAGSSLAAIAAAGSVGAVDVTLGGSIDMGVEFGLGKNEGNLSFGSAYNSVSLSLSAAGTTDHGMKYGASFSIGTAGELEVDAYDTNGADVAGGKHLIKMTVAGATDLEGAVYNVSGGQRISAGSVVGVKINSSWHSVDVTKTAHGLSVPNAIGANNICKIAGRVTETGTSGWGLSSVVKTNLNYNPSATSRFNSGTVRPLMVRQTDNGAVADTAVIGLDAYLPAGALGVFITAFGAGFKPTAKGVMTVTGTVSVTTLPRIPGAIVLTADAENGLPIMVDIPQHPAASPIVANQQNITSTFSGFSTAGMVVSQTSIVTGTVVFGTRDASQNVSKADIYAGPFAEVKLQSSSTKMVIGAVCVEGVESSATKYFLDNATKVVTATDASIFIEGGFGKLTLQTADYAGGVTSIGDAGDAADIDADGVVAIIEGVGLLGTSPYIAVDIRPGRALDANLEIITGGTIDIGGLSASFDVKLGTDGDPTDDTAAINPADFLDIAGWDLGLSYAMGDMAVAVAYDSGNDWGMSASMDVAGFGVDATIYNNDADDHKKSGLFYSVAASTSLDGFSLTLGVDQDLQPTINLSKSVGGLSIYAAYDAADEGGKVGATLSF